MRRKLFSSLSGKLLWFHFQLILLLCISLKIDEYSIVCGDNPELLFFYSILLLGLLEFLSKLKSFCLIGAMIGDFVLVMLLSRSEKEEKKLGDDRIIHDQVENNILLVSDVDARDTYDEVFVEAIDGFQADDGLHEDLPSKATPEHSMDDLEEENSNDKEVKDSKVSGETHGEANLQHITEGEAAPGFVTSKMNGDEGESGAEQDAL